jgi:hypothetical protein
MYVHSLHHRNADPEPFSGISMHPGVCSRRSCLAPFSPSAVEHLYYFSNAFIPALLMPTSPFVFVWLFVHLTFSPAAGHSGFEDHFQSDQYHYLHHARFECNYGSPFSAFIDQAMGTFRGSLGNSQEYTGGHKEAEQAKSGADAVDWSPNGYLGLPSSPTQAAYAVVTCALACLAWTSSVSRAPLSDWISPQLAAAAVAIGPLLVATLLHVCEKDRMSWRYPFHKERVCGSFGFFCAAALCVCVWPVFAAMSAVFKLR